MTAFPWSYHLHGAAMVALGAGLAALGWRVRWGQGRRRRAALVLGALVALLALTWPVADLAHVFLAGLVLQRLILVLALPPLLLAALPPRQPLHPWRFGALVTVIRALCRPVTAVALVTVVTVATSTTPVVAAQSSTPLAGAAVDLVMLAAGVVLWLPVFNRVPGAVPLSALGRASYLVVQSIVPSFLSIVWIFARHPLYAPFVHAQRIDGISSLLDQQISGFLAKLTTIAVLWTVAYLQWMRSSDADPFPPGPPGAPEVGAAPPVEPWDRAARAGGSRWAAWRPVPVAPSPTLPRADVTGELARTRGRPPGPQGTGHGSGLGGPEGRAASPGGPEGRAAGPGGPEGRAAGPGGPEGRAAGPGTDQPEGPEPPDR